MATALYIQISATYRQTIEWTAGGVAVDLTGCELRLLFFDLQRTALFQYDTRNDSQFAQLSAGMIELWITDEQTALMSACRSYEIYIDHPNGDVTALLDGPVAFGYPAQCDEGIVIIHDETIKIVSRGIQGLPGPPGPPGVCDETIPPAGWEVTP